MKLFYSKGACSLASHIALYEAGLNFEAVAVDLKSKTYKGGDFNKVNPKGYVPALQLENGQVLTEGAAILQYIADQKPEANLIPKAGSFERYRTQEWLTFIATEIHKTFSPLWAAQTPEEVKVQSKEKLAKRFDYLSTHFEKNKFLMGTQFTVCDAYLFTVMSWSNYVNIDLTKWPKLMGYMETVKSRAGVLAALKAEHII